MIPKGHPNMTFPRVKVPVLTQMRAETAPSNLFDICQIVCVRVPFPSLKVQKSHKMKGEKIRNLMWTDWDYYELSIVIAFSYFGWMMLCLGG